jgi:hypothetical protein
VKRGGATGVAPPVSIAQTKFRSVGNQQPRDYLCVERDAFRGYIATILYSSQRNRPDISAALIARTP